MLETKVHVSNPDDLLQQMIVYTLYIQNLSDIQIIYWFKPNTPFTFISMFLLLCMFFPSQICNL